MKCTVEKPKLPKGQSYVLKTSSLQELLNDTHIKTSVHLIYQHTSNSLSEIVLLDCHYWLPNANVPHSRFYVRTSAVPSKDRKIATDWMQLRVLPELIEWMTKIVAQPVGSTSIYHNMLFSAIFKDGKIRISYS